MTTKLDNSTMIWAAGLSWLALVLLIIIILGHLDDRRTSTQIQECIKAGKTPHECLCAFNPAKSICQKP